MGLAPKTAIIIRDNMEIEISIDEVEVGDIVFDKTGTLTEGKPKVTDIVTVEGISETYLLQVAASAEKGSEHPLGEAIVKGAEERSLELKKVDKFEAIPGYGIEVSI